MRLIRWAGALVLAAILAGAFLYYRVSGPYQRFQGTIYVDLARGTSTAGMASELANAGVIRSPLDFWIARLLNSGKVLQAGEYAFSQPASALEVFGRIARGDIFYLDLVVPEGRNIFDIAAAAEQLGVFPAADFLKAARDPALIRDLDPQAPTLEGYLFPSTYRLNRHTTPELLCRMMTERFRAAWRNLHADQPVSTIPLRWHRSSKRRGNCPRSGRSSPPSSTTASVWA